MHQKKIIFIVGPTAVGKTSLAVELACSLKGEIVSCDAMQVYREIAIVSAKPSRAQLERVPHHLVDIMSVDKEFDVARFNELANDAIKKILGNGRIPVVVGGSGMYVQTLLDGIFEGGESYPAIRGRLQEQIEKEGKETVYSRLKEVDPEAATKIHPNDMRRTVRALEIFESTGKKISQLQKERSGLWDSYDVALFGFTRPRERLYERIDRRVIKMFESGALEEIALLQNKQISKTAGQIIGVQEILGMLNKEYDQEQAQYLMQRNTRHFAKRQMTWFNKEARIQWFDLDQESVDSVQKKIIASIKE